jgi:ceramide glucosyltransferase
MMPVNNEDVIPNQISIELFRWIIGIPMLLLYIVVLFISIVGFSQILKNFNIKSQNELDRKISDEYLEGVTILRPLKGIDSQMEWCLESSFKQEYPVNRLEIIFCVQSKNDIAIPIVKNLINKYPNIDSKLMIDEDQEHLDYFGPNPKVNNLHKGYKNAKYDIVWVLDSNVYTYPHTLRRSVFTLQNNINNGSKYTTILGDKKKVEIVTHVPIVISTSNHKINWGSKLDEMFMSTSHAKFYTAINRIQPAPCINGKSNLYRKSKLDLSVENLNKQNIKNGEGLKTFAKYIGEDNMIGISLWDGVSGCCGMSKDIVLQPINGQSSIKDYINRRVRWLRVRKYMVLAATLLEPTTESLLCGIIGSFSINIIFNKQFNILWKWFIIHMIIWFIIDYIQYLNLFQLSNIALIENRKFRNLDFIKFWLLREILAFPIWLIAMCGSSIEWRGQPMRILTDLSAERL